MSLHSFGSIQISGDIVRKFTSPQTRPLPSPVSDIRSNPPLQRSKSAKSSRRNGLRRNPDCGVIFSPQQGSLGDPSSRVTPTTSGVEVPLTTKNICSILQLSGTFGKERGPGQQIILPGRVTRHPHSVVDSGSAERHGRSHRLSDYHMRYLPCPNSTLDSGPWTWN